LVWRLQEEAAGQGGYDSDDGALPKEVKTNPGDLVGVLLDEVYNHGFGWVWDQV
jgi:hypothetical protein